MEKSSFFNSMNHDRVYTAGDFAEFYGDLFTNGVLYETHDSLRVAAGSGMTLNLLPGSAWINGYRYFNTGTLPVALEIPDGTYPRVDRVVIRWDLTARAVYCAVLTGMPGPSPVPPPLTRNGGVFELGLAEIRAEGGSGWVEEGSITDTRLNPTLCGSSRTRTYLTFGEADTEALLGGFERLQSQIDVISSNTNVFTVTFMASLAAVRLFSFVDSASGVTETTLFQRIFSTTITNPLFKPGSIVFANAQGYTISVGYVGAGTCQIGGAGTPYQGSYSGWAIPPINAQITVNVAVFNH